MIQFLNKDGQGEGQRKEEQAYRKGLARQLNQAQCGQGTWTDCYFNRLTIQAVARLTQLLEVVAKSTGQLEGITGGPGKGRQAEGAGGQG